MKKIETELMDCYILEPDRFGDNRGYFSPYFLAKNLEELGFKKVVQASRSKSSKGVLRGFHFQAHPKSQAKLVEVIKGSAIDVIIDMRIDSETYGKYIAVKLTDKNNRQLYIPRGFAHGFLSLEDNTIFQYLVDNDYAKDFEGGILWNDPDLNINWNKLFKENGIKEPILSDKDKTYPKLKDNRIIFKKNNTKYLITGYSGQLGYDIKKELIRHGVDEKSILTPSKYEMDITKKEEVDKVVKDFRPDVIFHSAAYTQVDKAEIDTKKCYNVNVTGTKNITDVSIEIGCKIIYISTDYVFDGTKDGEYEIEDIPNPKNVYGQTKYLGEKEIVRNPKHFIIRTSWLFGINGNNFVKTMLSLADKYNEVNVVSDQTGSPTYTHDLARLLVDISKTNKYGLYHASNEGYTSWANFAEYIFKINNKDVKVNHISTEKYAKLNNITQAYRPKNSKLSKKSLDDTLSRLPNWKEAIIRYSNELNK